MRSAKKVKTGVSKSFGLEESGTSVIKVIDLVRTSSSTIATGPTVLTTRVQRTRTRGFAGGRAVSGR